METETIAELQARYDKLELKAAELKGKADETSKVKLESYRHEQAAIQSKIELSKRDDRMKQMEAIETARREKDAKEAVEVMCKKGLIGRMDLETKEHWQKNFTETPALIGSMTALEAGSALPSTALTRVAPTGTAVALQGASGGGEYSMLSGGRSISGALKRYYELASENRNCDTRGMFCAEGMMRKGQIAQEMAAVFKADLEPKDCATRWEHLPLTELGKIVGLQARRSNGPLQAADNTDVSLGTLSGTLVLQRTLPVFAFEYPELLKVYTDFSDTPGLYNQTEMTRIVVQAPVELFDTATDASGRAKGWDNVVAAVTTDVPLTLNKYIGVPIVFNNVTLASTTRRLFDEQAVLAVKAIAGYFTGMLTDLITGTNYNSYAGATGNYVPGSVPLLGATYVQGIQSFSNSDIDSIGSAFDLAKVPVGDRSIMLNPLYFGKLRGDPRLWYMYMGSAGNAALPTTGSSGFLSERALPKLGGFAPYNAPYLLGSNPQVNPTQFNVVGFAFHKAAAILKSRLPTDFTRALGGIPIPGSVTTITDPDTKISIMLVQYVNLTQGYAEWRVEVMLGAAKGDPRAGIVMTSA